MNHKLRGMAIGMLCLAWLPGRAAGNPADEDGGKPVASKITEVAVYADRARVTRSGAVTLPAGTARFAFGKLPGWLDEGSVRVVVSPAGAAELVDVQVLKTWLARPDDEEIQKAILAVQDLADRIAALDDERAALDARARQIDSIRAFSLEKLPQDVAAREVKVEEYAGVVKFVGDSLLELARARRELDKVRRELQPELTARQRALNELRQRAQLEQRTVLVTLKADAAREASVTLAYMLPGATWEPLHEVRAANGANAVGLASFGVVTQTTGEDWDNVAVSLSTQRPTDTIRIPELEALLLGSGRALAWRQSGAGETFKTATAQFEAQSVAGNELFNIGRLAAGDFARNYEQQKARQSRVTEVFQSIQQQRGTTAHFIALGPQTIRTDGRPVRVPIGAAQLAASPRIMAAPELSLNATHIVELTNAGRQPLLPGRVLLYVDGAFLGTTDMEFVAQGESFPMFLGVADEIKLSRSLDRKRSSLSWSGRRARMQVSFVVSAENLSERPVTLQLADRVPVSETEEIRVVSVRVAPEGRPDPKGLIKWELTLSPKQTREFRIEYTLDYPRDLPQQAVTASGGMLSEPGITLERKIVDLEQMLK
jgi:uncharacterized protein (TIGR02231 family)